MSRDLLEIEQVLMLVEETPTRIAEVTDGLTEALLHTAPEPGAWSANDVLAHIRACADMWGKVILTMIAGDHAKLRSIHPRQWIKQTDYLDLEFRPSLRAHGEQRAELLAVLTALPPEDWSRGAMVTGASQPRAWTVHSRAEGMARHERLHVEQIEHIVKALRIASETA